MKFKDSYRNWRVSFNNSPGNLGVLRGGLRDCRDRVCFSGCLVRDVSPSPVIMGSFLVLNILYLRK